MIRHWRIGASLVLVALVGLTYTMILGQSSKAGVPPGIGCYTHVQMLEWHMEKAIIQLDSGDPQGAYITLRQGMGHH